MAEKIPVMSSEPIPNDEKNEGLGDEVLGIAESENGLRNKDSDAQGDSIENNELSDGTPLKISRDGVAILKNGTIFISDVESLDPWSRFCFFDAIDDKVLGIRSSDEEWRWNDEKEKEIAWSYKYFRPITADDLVVRRADRELSEEEQRERVSDFVHFSSEYVASEIEGKFGICLANLFLVEQSCFFKFLKNCPKSEIESVKRFVQKFGVAGVKLFNSLDYGNDMMDRLVSLGEKLDKMTADRLFESYNEVTRLGFGLAETVRKAGTVKDSTLPLDAKRGLPGEIYEAILRRSKDLLVAAHMVGVERWETGFSVDDVVGALEGIELLLGILSDFEGREENFAIEEKESPSSNHFIYEIDDRRFTEWITYKLKIFIRPKAENQSQARINFELDFDTEHPTPMRLKELFHQITDYKQQKKTVDESVLRIGIDLDTHGEKPEVSLDLGRARYSSDKLDRTGDALGNILALVDKGEGHHTTRSFSEIYSDPTIFSEIAEVLWNYFNKKGRMPHMRLETHGL